VALKATEFDTKNHPTLQIVENTGNCVAGRQGVSWSISRNTNKDGPFSRKPRHASNFASSSSFVFFRRFASVFGFCQRNDTHNDTRHEGLPGLSPRRSGERVGEWFSSKWRQALESRRLVEAERCLSQDGVEPGQQSLSLSLNHPLNSGRLLRLGVRSASWLVPKLRREAVDLHLEVLVVAIRSDRTYNDLAHRLH
jgi:hypothetical protein